MATLAMINSIKLLIAVFVSYFPTVAISGYFAAFVAKKMGDDTAEREGLLTLNPAEHIRFFGLITLLMSVVTNLPFIVAFGRTIPIDEHHINLPFRKIKYLIALWARPFANLFLSCTAIGIWVFFWKLIGFPYAINIKYPSLVGAMEILYVIFRQINIITLMLEFIFGFVVFIMSFIFPQMADDSLFVILIVQIYLLILSWYLVAPYVHGAVIMVENLFSYLIL